MSAVLPEDAVTHNRGGSLDQVYTNLVVEHGQLTSVDSRLSDHMMISATLRFIQEERDFRMHQPGEGVTLKAIRQAARSQAFQETLLHSEDMLSAQYSEEI